MDTVAVFLTPLFAGITGHLRLRAILKSGHAIALFKVEIVRVVACDHAAGRITNEKFPAVIDPGHGHLFRLHLSV